MASKNNIISSVSLVDADLRHKREKEKLISKIRPSQKDNNDRLEQCELAKKLFESGQSFSDEELLEMGYYVRQHYLVEKRRQEASIIAYNAGKEWYYSGKDIIMAAKIYQNNADFLRGYNDAIKEEINNQSRGNSR